MKTMALQFFMKAQLLNNNFLYMQVFMVNRV